MSMSNVPGKMQGGQNQTSADAKLYMLLAESFIKMGNSMKQGFASAQMGDAQGMRRASAEQALAKTEMAQVKQALAMRQAKGDKPLAGGGGRMPAESGARDAQTGQDMRSRSY